eukprot:g29227.t1
MLVSLNSMVGKLLEAILRDSINLHLERQGLIKNSLHGFVKDRKVDQKFADDMKIGGMRRLKEGKIEMYKIMRGTDRVDRKKSFSLVEGSKTRRHTFKFSDLFLIDSWNNMPKTNSKKVIA